jgi:predicted regulator of Ras-like GTPase activity (Roadblock/LC7/MglB family)
VLNTVKKKRNLQANVTTIMVDGVSVPEFEEDPNFITLSTSLSEIIKIPGVVGYILRNTNSAEIDLPDQAKLTDFAIISAQAIESGKEIAELFNLGNVENILIEGKDLKIICATIGENKVSVFMEKGVEHADIIARISR